MRTCTPLLPPLGPVIPESWRRVKRSGRDADRRQSRRLAAKTVRAESGRDESLSRCRGAFAGVEAALWAHGYQYSTRLEASNRVAERLASGRADNGERVFRHRANQ